VRVEQPLCVVVSKIIFCIIPARDGAVTAEHD